MLERLYALLVFAEQQYEEKGKTDYYAGIIEGIKWAISEAQQIEGE